MSGENRIEKTLNAFIESRKRPVRADRELASRVMSSIRSWEKEEEWKRSTLELGR